MIKTRSVFIAASVGAAVQIVYISIVMGISAIFVPDVLRNLHLSIPEIQGRTVVPGFFGLTTVIGGVGILLAPVVHAGVGFLYAFVRRREAGSVTSEEGAIGGAVSALAGRLASGFVNLFLSAIVTSILFRSFSEGVGPPFGAFQEGWPYFFGFSTVVNVFGGLVGICFGGLFAAILGAMGGALGGAVLK